MPSLLALLPLLLAVPVDATHPASPVERARYAWLHEGAPVRSLDVALPAPPGFTRIPVAPGSFAAFLRELPLQPAGTPVRAHDGSIARQAGDPGVAAVAALDVGKKDLQQCADSIIRLHDEWLWSAKGRRAELADRLTSGDLAEWRRWAQGYRATVRKNRVTWENRAAPDASRESFRAWLDLVFTYAGTLSLERDGLPVPLAQVDPGDYLVQGGSPGHVVLVLDVARSRSGETRVLVGQGYTPAQDFHVLRGPDGPWFPVRGDALETPFWQPFPWSTLRRFKPPGGGGLQRL